MLNKKIVAAAVAAAFTQSAIAAVDIDDTVAPQLVTIASELVTPVAGIVNIDNSGTGTGAATALDIEVTAGFTISSGTAKYMRFDFTGAKFNRDATGELAVTNAVGGAGTLSAGGQVGDDYVIFEVVGDTLDVTPTGDVTLAAGAYTIDAVGTSQVCYSLFETSIDAVANDATRTLKSACQSFAALGSAYSGTFASGVNQIATVDSNFTQFTDGAPTPSEVGFGVVGIIDATGSPTVTPVTSTSILVPNVLAANSDPVTAADLVNATIPGTAVTQVVRVTGDFTFGTWTLESTDACDGTGTTPIAITADISKTFGETATVDTADLTSAPWYVCVNVDGTETIQKDTYSVTLVDSVLTNTIGTIKYDTTSIEVPYLTTFSEYKQRIYLINQGTADAEYSMTFITEDGITATDGPKATGVVPAGKMLMINAAEAVTLTGGKTRTAATIDVEGVDAKIQAAVQSVNLSTGDTDTVVLNANSITSPNK
jgi:hypothetical protein